MLSMQLSSHTFECSRIADGNHFSDPIRGDEPVELFIQIPQLFHGLKDFHLGHKGSDLKALIFLLPLLLLLFHGTTSFFFGDLHPPSLRPILIRPGCTTTKDPISLSPSCFTSLLRSLAICLRVWDGNLIKITPIDSSPCE